MKNQIKENIILLTIASLSLFLNHSLFAQTDLDQELAQIIKEEGLIPLEPIKRNMKTDVVRLGAFLFNETSLSGNRDMSCHTCHVPHFATTEPLPFSIGTGGRGMGSRRFQANGGVTRRHSPHLFNLGYQDIEFMFWDGRVYRSQETGELQTPEATLNGPSPIRPDITSQLETSLAVQTIFPIVNELEMMGQNNDIADQKTNPKRWDAVMKRLLTGEKKEVYFEQFKKAFPGTPEEDLNIGHVGKALGEFISNGFNLTDTPYDRYLKGDLNALTLEEKKGLVVFAKRGQCLNCHNGRHLSNFEFKTVGTPQVAWEKHPAPYDNGRFEVTGNKRDLFKFRTPTLRNVSITAPFMHTGVYQTLEEVIEHYDNPKLALESFDLSKMDLSFYQDNFVVDRDEKRNKLRINLISIGEVRRGLNLTQSEKEDLLQFLKTGLLDYRFQRGRL